MPRVKRDVVAHARHKKVLDKAKGYRGAGLETRHSDPGDCRIGDRRWTAVPLQRIL